MERAFGREGLGIAVVTGVPDIAHLRRELFAAGQRYDRRCVRFLGTQPCRPKHEKRIPVYQVCTM